jgi:hypothetical protein
MMLTSRAATLRTIHGLFTEAGWAVEPVEGGWRLERSAFGPRCLYAGLNENWLSLQLPLQLEPAASARQRGDLYLKLLDLNERRVFLAKFALDEGERLLLCTELSLRNFQSRLLRRALEALEHYGPLYPELLRESLAPAREAAPTGRPADGTSSLLAETFMEFVLSVRLENWGARERAQGDVWKLLYKGRLRTYDVYFTLTKSWVAFQVPVLREVKPSALHSDDHYRALFLRYLLRLCDEFYMVKFGLDEEGQLLFLLELPLQELNYDLFLLATRTISRYLESHTQELEIMASPDRDENIRRLLIRTDRSEHLSQRSN